MYTLKQYIISSGFPSEAKPSTSIIMSKISHQTSVCDSTSPKAGLFMMQHLPKLLLHMRLGPVLSRLVSLLHLLLRLLGFLASSSALAVGEIGCESQLLLSFVARK